MVPTLTLLYVINVCSEIHLLKLYKMWIFTETSGPSISDRNDFIFDLRVAPILSIRFRVNWPFGSVGVQNSFLKWRSSLISDRNDFNFLCPRLPKTGMGHIAFCRDVKSVCARVHMSRS